MREIETLAKLRQQELVQEALHEQAVRRFLPQTRWSKQWKPGVLAAAAAVVIPILLPLAL